MIFFNPKFPELTNYELKFIYLFSFIHKLICD